jgi:hypothetical protein
MERLPTGFKTAIFAALTAVTVSACSSQEATRTKPKSASVERSTLKNKPVVDSVGMDERKNTTIQIESKIATKPEKPKEEYRLKPLDIQKFQSLEKYIDSIPALTPERYRDCTYAVSMVLSYLDLITQFDSTEVTYEPYAPHLNRMLSGSGMVEKITNIDEIDQLAIVLYLDSEGFATHAFVILKYTDSNGKVEWVTIENSSSEAGINTYWGKERIIQRDIKKKNPIIYNFLGRQRH